MLVLLYYLSQNPDFAQSVKPLMGQLKNSQQMLNFLNDLSKFNETFSTIKQQSNQKTDAEKEPQQKNEGERKSEEPQKQNSVDGEEKEKSSQSPTAGIADDFIQKILEGYLKK